MFSIEWSSTQQCRKITILYDDVTGEAGSHWRIYVCENQKRYILASESFCYTSDGNDGSTVGNKSCSKKSQYVHRKLLGFDPDTTRDEQARSGNIGLPIGKTLMSHLLSWWSSNPNMLKIHPRI